MADHNTPTGQAISHPDEIKDETSRQQVSTLQSNCDEMSIPMVELADQRRGIVHIVGPEQGFSLPGTTVVCGDSHTSTHGALGALAMGIGTSEVEHVMATGCLAAPRLKNMSVWLEGELPPGLTSKDIILEVIRVVGVLWRAGLCHRIWRSSHPRIEHRGAHDDVQHEH